MADSFEVKLEGVDDVLDRLSKLEDYVQKKAIRVAGRKGANVIRKAVTTRARQIDDPDSEEKIWKNVTVQFASRTSRQIGGAVFRVGIQGGAKSPKKQGLTKTQKRGKRGVEGKTGAPGGDTWYWRFVEFGIKSRGIGAREFMQPAMVASAEDATKVFVNSLWDEINKSIGVVA